MTNELTTLSSRLEAFEQRAVQHHQRELGTIWDPNAGDSVFGAILNIESVTHPRIEQRFRLRIKDKNGSVFLIWLTKYLRSELVMQNAEPNDLIAITYIGGQQNSKSSDCNNYKITIEKE
jgi:hypothetical protein